MNATLYGGSVLVVLDEMGAARNTVAGLALLAEFFDLSSAVNSRNSFFTS